MTPRSLILTDLDEIERILWANPDGTCITVRNDIGAYELILGGVRFLAPLAAGSAASLPSWCRCPDDCDCDGRLVPADVCDERAGLTETWCALPAGHEGWHRSASGAHGWDRTEDRAS